MAEADELVRRSGKVAISHIQRPLMMSGDSKDDELPKDEADRRRDELARRILKTPPEPRKPLGKRKPSKKGKPAK